jgi:hypothetical protein
MFFLNYLVLDILVGLYFNKKCLTKSNQFLIVLILHHIVSVSILVGWTVNNKYLLGLYVILVLSTLTHWNTNNNLCAITVYHNKLCGIDEKTPFKDIIYMLGFKNSKWWNSTGIYYYLVMSVLISIYKCLSSG